MLETICGLREVICLLLTVMHGQSHRQPGWFDGCRTCTRITQAAPPSVATSPQCSSREAPEVEAGDGEVIPTPTHQCGLAHHSKAASPGQMETSPSAIPKSNNNNIYNIVLQDRVINPRHRVLVFLIARIQYHPVRRTVKAQYLLCSSRSHIPLICQVWFV